MFRGSVRVLATHTIHQFPLHYPHYRVPPGFKHTLIFYEQTQRGRYFVTQVWSLVYLSAGFNLSFHLMSGTCAAFPVTSAGFTKDYSYVSCLPPIFH
jgi:hypothetical protein